MTTFNTGNPVPSADARDRSDNSQTFDEVISGALTYYPNRVGQNVLSLNGMQSLFNAEQADRASAFSVEQDRRDDAFQQFIESSGWSSLGPYAAGVTITSHSQTVDYMGQPYQLKPSISVSLDDPYVTTGDWATESVNFKLVGDNSLRQDLAAPDGSSVSGFRQLGVGAANRNAMEKLLEQPITIEDFLPDIVYVEAPYGQAEVDAATIIDDALDKALTLARSTGRPIRLPAKVYKCARYHDLSAPLDMQGIGAGRWQPTVNAGVAGGANKPNMEGTIFLVTGTYTRNKYATGITDCRTAGGVLPNTDIREPGYDSNYQLTNFYNEDANVTTGAAATRKAFSAAFGFNPGSRGAILKNFRIMLSNRGIAGHHDQDLNLGDDVDVGLYMDNTDYNTVENVYVVGPWRIAGRFARIGICNNEADGTGGEHNMLKGCVLTGAVGDLVRGPDLCRVVGVGADYIDLPWAENHPYDSALLGVFRRGESPETFFSFAGTAVVGGNLRLTGVTPNPITSGMTTSATVTPGTLSGGIGQIQTESCTLSGLDHQAAVRATSAALGVHRLSKPSAALEISGWRLRGYRAPFTKIMTHDDVAIHAHNATDLYLGPLNEIESKIADGLPLGVRVITTPSVGNNTRVLNPAGQTFRFCIDSIAVGSSVDMRPNIPTIPPRFPSAAKYFEANQFKVTGFQTPVFDGVYLQSFKNGFAALKGSDGGRRLTYHDVDDTIRATANLWLGKNNLFNSTGIEKISVIGGVTALDTLFLVRPDAASPASMRVSTTDWRPGTDNTIDLGTPSARLKTLYATTGAINISDATHKTMVRSFTSSEVAVSQALLQEIGMYQFLDAVALKGPDARWHVGMTVQRAIEIFEQCGLDPFRNAFVCYDEWDDIYEEWDDIYETAEAIIDAETGGEIRPETQILVKAAGKMLVREAGNAYSFRNDQLALAMLAGVAATQRDLEARLSELENLNG